MTELTPKKILIIEDEPGIYDTIRYTLKTEGFETEWSKTGNDALKILKRIHFDLILLDIGLPDINGFELLKLIRRETPVPVIFLTARSAEIDKILGLELGGDDYITKPFSPRELAARVKAVLRRITPPSDKTEAEGQTIPSPLVLDYKKKQIIFYDTPVGFSRYEFLLLEKLIKHPGWVFSREQLIQHVWKDPDISLERTIDSHIKNIRQKFKKIKPDLEIIYTHHGMGYSLREKW